MFKFKLYYFHISQLLILRPTNIPQLARMMWKMLSSCHLLKRTPPALAFSPAKARRGCKEIEITQTPHWGSTWFVLLYLSVSASLTSLWSSMHLHHTHTHPICGWLSHECFAKVPERFRTVITFIRIYIYMYIYSYIYTHVYIYI